MFDKICNVVNGKNVLILGFGREGKSTYRFLCKYAKCKSVTIADSRELEPVENAELKVGADYQKGIEKFDVIIKSPGIVLENQSEDLLKKITSQTELFFMCFSNQTIGITGTKGKSTTSTLIYHILKDKVDDCLLMGNIGVPSFDMMEQIDDKTIIVYELSCHQLEYTNISPKTAIMLNLYPEHLDHYGTYEKYVHAKENIYRYQKENDLLICNAANLPKECGGKVLSISSDGTSADIMTHERNIRYNGKEIMINENDTALVGNHNVFNIAAAYAVCGEYGVNDEEFFASLKTYKPLAHRLEFIGEKDGVKYYDDSISTICETTIQALESLKNVGSVIIGGMDRGIDYTPLTEYLKNAEVDNIILIPNTGECIAEILKNTDIAEKVVMADDLRDAAEKAKKITEKGKICVMSPAAASYGFFKNFEERGKAFKEYIGL